MQRPEQQLHFAVVAHLKQRGMPGLVWLHPANGGYRKATEAAILAGLGVVPGAPDLLMWCHDSSYALELKADGGKLSEAQRVMLDRLAGAGVHVAVAHGIDEAIAVLEQWQLVTGRVQ